jgi:hypothetical protein
LINFYLNITSIYSNVIVNYKNNIITQISEISRSRNNLFEHLYFDFYINLQNVISITVYTQLIHLLHFNKVSVSILLSI